MAKMIPPEAPVASRREQAESPEWVRSSTHSERATFLALRDGLPDTYTVVWGIEYLSRANGREGEVDFLICHPRHGLLFMECKGTGVTRDATGAWRRRSPAGRYTRTTSPTTQVKRQMRDQMSRFKRRYDRTFPENAGSFPLPWGYALIFPFTDRSDDILDDDLNPDLLLDRSDLDTIEKSVERAMYAGAGWTNKSTLNEHEFNRLLSDVIMPSYNVIADLRDQIANEKRIYRRLDAQQRTATSVIVHNPRVEVLGSAGTGKTMVAIRAAEAARARGERVLVMCFNRMLADYLDQRLNPPVADDKDYVGSVDVFHFHRLCVESIQAMQVGPLEFPASDADLETRQSFWRQTVPSLFFEAIVKASEPESRLDLRWDRIIIDEWQDFDVDWYELIEHLLSDARPNYLSLLFDPEQIIFERRHERRPDFAYIPLVHNYRNPRKLVSYLLEINPDCGKPHRDAPDGESPHIYPNRSPKVVRKEVSTVLGRLLREEGLRTEQIVILSPHRPEGSSLGKRIELDGVPITNKQSERANAVLHTTIAAFKGMESDVVLLIDLDPTDDRCSPAIHYVAASRARHRLYVWKQLS